MSEAKKIKEAFRKNIKLTIEHNDELHHEIHHNVSRGSLETVLSEQLAMTVATQWEAFINDLLTAYVLARPKKVLEDFQRKSKNLIEEKYGTEVARRISFDTKRKPTGANISVLLDPQQRNISANTASNLAKIADKHLNAQQAKKFSLKAEDRQFIDYLIALRNFLAHRSVGSRERLKGAVDNLTHPDNSAFSGPMGRFESYLRQRDGRDNTRAKLIALRIQKISRKL